MKAYTDIEQSKKLTTILPLESADMIFLSEESLIPPKVKYNGMAFFNSDEEIPTTLIHCWSLAALLSILPVTARLLKDGNISNTGDIKYNCECSMINIHKWFDNPVDACVEMVLKLNELNLL